MKKLTNLIIAAVLTAGLSGVLKAGSFESDLQSGLKAIPVPAAPRQQVSQRLSGLGELTVKMVSVKAKMERVELSLWEVNRLLENKESGSVDRVLQELMQELKECTVSAKELNTMAGPAIARTPKTPDTMATAKLLLANIAEYTDNDETIVLLRVEQINKSYPAYESKMRPLIEEYVKALEEISGAGTKVMAFSGPLQTE
ncbi:MAG: hypothetical protein NTX59_12615 [Elusimicrobia bacterium]|nr:hypothetical protein [Elusimicrobiota bacterium]